MTFPSGPSARDFSSAPRLFLYQSIACAELSKMRCGVTMWNPSGTGLFAFAMALSFRHAINRALCGRGCPGNLVSSEIQDPTGAVNRHRSG